MPAAFSALSARQEDFAGAYIRAICATAGCAVSVPYPDDDKIDFTVSSRVLGTVRTKPKIDIQSKCERGGAAANDPIAYSVDIETYDNLRDPLVANPRILVVVLVPPSEQNWLSQDEANLALKHCAYWVSIKGAAEVVGQASKTVHLPRANVFTPSKLQALMHLAADGSDLL